jgi:peptidoglycan L-alanyl-D-glutamate endopeptidase CwlK
MALLHRERLAGVHPDLVRVIELAAETAPFDLAITEGLRTKAKQAEYVKSGASQTMNSRHLTGHAVDITPYVDNKISYAWPLYYKLEPVVKAAAKKLNVKIQWGGDWKKFKDGPHWELDWKAYPELKTLPFTDRIVEAPTPPEVEARESDPKFTQTSTVKSAGIAGAAATVSLAAEVAKNAGDIASGVGTVAEQSKPFWSYLPMIGLVVAIGVIAFLLWDKWKDHKAGDRDAK